MDRLLLGRDSGIMLKFDGVLIFRKELIVMGKEVNYR